MKEAEKQEWETTDVMICGAGPTGTLLSAVLDRMFVKNIVLEKEQDIPPNPRAFSLGEDGIRHLQALGLYKHIFAEMGRDMPRSLFIGGGEPDLHKRPFLVLNLENMVSSTGHVAAYMFKQPVMESYLRSLIAQSPWSAVRVRSTVTSIYQDENWAYVRYSDPQGKVKRIRAKFLVGADGKTGFTRKMYLEAQGIEMERTHRYEETWVGSNWDVTMPTPDTHPAFPLWQLGYTPHQAFEAFFPNEFIFISNPRRPGAYGLIGKPGENPGLVRFEYSVQQGEEVAEMATPSKVKEIVSAYFTHRGNRYGLDYDVQFPEDCMNVRTITPYTFAARNCNRWAHGRVILAGDAAHVFPPFGGQGLGSSFNDVAGLAWRLAIALQPDTPAFEHLLTAWYMERNQAIKKALDYTVRNGDILTEANPIKIYIRDWMLWAVRLVPSWKREIESPDIGIKGYVYESGMTFLPHLGGGAYFPQVYCVPLDAEKSQSPVTFTDDLIFATRKQGLFQLVVLVDTLAQVDAEVKILADIDELSESRVLASDVTYIIHDPLSSALEQNVSGAYTRNVARIATLEEFAQSPLCKGRPKPLTYDEYRLKKSFGEQRYIIVRPDYFVFASCTTNVQLAQALGSIGKLLRGESLEI